MTLSYQELSEEKVGFAMKHKASLCTEVEAFLPMSWRQKLFQLQNFQQPLEFDPGDVGPSGGIQVPCRVHVKVLVCIVFVN
jgi:hypothetical protein